MTAAEAFEAWWKMNGWGTVHCVEYRLADQAWLAAWTQAVAQTREMDAQLVDNDSKCKRSGFQTCQSICDGQCDLAAALRRGEELQR